MRPLCYSRLPNSRICVIEPKSSVHAPARGATGPCGSVSPQACFNSRAREGRDLYFLHLVNGPDVSIHAPARGATLRRVQGGPQNQCFNSRAREGRDRTHARQLRICASFNSRAREGRDREAFANEYKVAVSIHAPARVATRTHARQLRICASFNSRAREGRDSQP